MGTSTARTQRTRAAIVDALLELVGGGEPEPTVDRIAEEAKVSVRTVYGHFGSVADLHQALVERVTELVVDRVEVISLDEPLAVRIDLLGSQRARINEELGPLLLAAARFQSRSEVLDRSRRTGRDASAAQIRRVLGAELSVLGAAAQARRVATIDALLGVSTWQQLRTGHHLSVDQARIATIEAVSELVRPAGAS